MLKPLSVLLCALALVLAACGDDDDDQPAEKKQAAVASPRRSRRPAARTSRSRRRATTAAQKKPQKPLDPARPTSVDLTTSCGDFTIRLDQKTSPNAAASFVALARSGFFDDTIFHRIVPGFVIQGGDPTASGTGGPGYSTRDTPFRPNAAYDPGCGGDGKGRQTSRPAPPAASSSWSPAPTPGCRPTTRCSARSRRAWTWSQAIGELGDPASGGAGTPLQSVVIEGAKVRER